MNSSYKNSLSFNRDVNKINQDYNEVYKRVKIWIILILLFQPIPIDSINKYWGVDAVFSKHDETLQKQSYFSYIVFPQLFFEKMPQHHIFLDQF